MEMLEIKAETVHALGGHASKYQIQTKGKRKCCALI